MQICPGEPLHLLCLFFSAMGAKLQGEHDVVLVGHAAHVQDGIAHAA